MKKLLIVPVLVFLIGCASFSTNVFRTEQAAVGVAYAAYVEYTNNLATLHLTVDQSNAVKQARLKFAATVSVLDAWRMAYETNSAVKPQVNSALAATASSASNFVWLIHYVQGL